MIKELTSLRGIFIFFIFFHHCLNLFPGGGTMGVAFFFVLGGFSMTLGYKDKVLQQGFSYKQYLLKRCIKFYPLHWLCLLAALPIALSDFHLKQIPMFFLNASLLQTWMPEESVYFSFNAVSWYLADTLFFAIVFPPLIKSIVKVKAQTRIFVSIMLFTVYLAVVLLTPTVNYHYVLYICPLMRLFDFIIGVFLALGYLRWKDKPKDGLSLNNGLISALIIVNIVLLIIESCLLDKTFNKIAALYWPLVATLVLLASLLPVACDPKKMKGLMCNLMGGGNLLLNKYLQHLGDLSFTIFLTHQLVIRYTQIFFNKLQINQQVVYVITTILITLIVSDLVNRYVLNSITKWLTKKILPSMTAR